MMRRLWLLALLSTLASAGPALAQEPAGTGEGLSAEEKVALEAKAEYRAEGSTVWLHSSGLALIGATIGAGLVIFAGAGGIGRIGSTAAESIARQPESSGPIFNIGLITAAMVEGATLFAIIVCLLAVLWGRYLQPENFVG